MTKAGRRKHTKSGARREAHDVRRRPGERRDQAAAQGGTRGRRQIFAVTKDAIRPAFVAGILPCAWLPGTATCQAQKVVLPAELRKVQVLTR